MSLNSLVRSYAIEAVFLYGASATTTAFSLPLPLYETELMYLLFMVVFF